MGYDTSLSVWDEGKVVASVRELDPHGALQGVVMLKSRPRLVRLCSRQSLLDRKSTRLNSSHR